MKHNHIYYDIVEKGIRPHLEKYGEPWQYREPLIRDVLDGLFREPYNVVDNGVDIIGDERD